MKTKNIIKSISTSLALTALVGCNSDSNPINSVECSDCAVVTTVAADYGSSAIDFVATTFPYTAQTGYAAQDLSDIRATTFGDHFYRLGRFEQDNISKWSFNNVVTPTWEFSVGSFANPYDVIFVSETKAYILRWGENEIWVVDPSVANNSDEANFKIGEIDLTVYNQGAGSNAASAILDNGFLYIVLEGFDASYVPQTSHLIKIDTMTDTEVDVNGVAAGNGYALTVKNAGDLELLGTDIYVAGKGRYASSFANPPTARELTGGIELVDASGATFTSSLLVDDDDANVNAQITSVEVASATKGYLTTYNGFEDLDVIEFNPTTGAVEASPLTGYASTDIRFIEIDDNNQLWIGVGNATAPRIDILSTIDNSELGTVALTRNPSAIKFADTTN
jgi:hypothetical protein